MKIILSDIVGTSMTELTESVLIVGVSIIHNVLSCLVPCIINFLLTNMLSFSFVKCAVHPKSHSCSIDSSEPEDNSLMMCDLVASSGKSGFFNLQVCGDCMIALFVGSTCMPFYVDFMFMTGIVM